MHIAFLTPEYPHPKIKNAAGIGTSIKNLAMALYAKDHDLSIFVYSQDNTEILNDNGINVYKIAYKKYPVLGWYLHRKYIQNFVNQQIDKFKIQVLEAPDWTGITAFMKFKCPLVIRLHGTDAYFCHLEGRKQKFKNYILEKKALKSADYIVSVSEFTAKTTKSLFKIKKEMRVIYNGIDTQLFHKSEQPPEPYTILYFGTLIRKKGVLALALIFNELIKQEPKAVLTLIGNDVEDIFKKKSTLEIFTSMLSTDAKKNIRYKAQVPYKTIIKEIEKASVVVLPSFAEAFPMTWLEAMAMGKGLVTSDIGWAEELMQDGITGFTVHPTNNKEYAHRILQLLRDKRLNKTLGLNASKRIEKQFSQEKISMSNEHYFQKIIDGTITSI